MPLAFMHLCIAVLVMGAASSSTVCHASSLGDIHPSAEEKERFRKAHKGVYLPAMYMHPGEVSFSQRKRIAADFSAADFSDADLHALETYRHDTARNFWLRSESVSLQMASGKLSHDKLLKETKVRAELDPNEWIIYVTAVLADCKINSRRPSDAEAEQIQQLLESDTLNVRSVALDAVLSLGMPLSDQAIAKCYRGGEFREWLVPRSLTTTVRDATTEHGSIDDAVLQLIGREDKYPQLWSLNYLMVWGEPGMAEQVEAAMMELDEADQLIPGVGHRFKLCIEVLNRDLQEDE